MNVECLHTLIHNFRSRNEPACVQTRVSSAPSQDTTAESPYLGPYVTFPGDMSKYGTCPVHALGGVYLSFSYGHFTHVYFAVRFYAQRHRPDGDAAQQSWSRTKESRRGPGAGWGSTLCCSIVILPPGRWLRNLLPCWRWWPTAVEGNRALRINREEYLWRFNYICWDNISAYEI